MCQTGKTENIEAKKLQRKCKRQRAKYFHFHHRKPCNSEEVGGIYRNDSKQIWPWTKDKNPNKIRRFAD